jgi:hypothetical protein
VTAGRASIGSAVGRSIQTPTAATTAAPAATRASAVAPGRPGSTRAPCQPAGISRLSTAAPRPTPPAAPLRDMDGNESGTVGEPAVGSAGSASGSAGGSAGGWPRPRSAAPSAGRCGGHTPPGTARPPPPGGGGAPRRAASRSGGEEGSDRVTCPTLRPVGGSARRSIAPVDGRTPRGTTHPTRSPCRASCADLGCGQQLDRRHHHVEADSGPVSRRTTRSDRPRAGSSRGRRRRSPRYR